MARRPATGTSEHSLGLFRRAGRQLPPRDNGGRFTRIHHSAGQRLVLRKAIEMRAALGLPADPRLDADGSIMKTMEMAS